MGSAHPANTNGYAEPTLRVEKISEELKALRAENSQLRELVIHLSGLVLRNVAERCS